MKDDSRKKLIIVTGLLFIFAGILLNEWVLAALFAADGVIEGRLKKIIIWGFDILTVFIGVLILRSRNKGGIEYIRSKYIALFFNRLQKATLFFNRLQKATLVIGYIIYLGLFIFIFDTVVLKHILGFGYPRHYEEENVYRYPAPYVMFTGKPNVMDHNDLGFRGASLKDADSSDFKVAFFGGSTGYHGTPPIAKVVEKELEKILNVDVFVANYSVVSSNHRQHLHGIIEFLPKYKPDLVIFYGGWNETIQTGFYDPRPGYPYNHFYRAETSTVVKLLIENSALIGEADKKFGLFTGIRGMRMAQQPFSANWNNRIFKKYFETLELASNVARSISSHYCGNTKFLAFYQPYQVPANFLSTHKNIKSHISSMEYVFDVSSEYDGLGKEIFLDIVHVKQEARNLIGKKIATIIAEELRRGGLSDCRLLFENEARPF